MRKRITVTGRGIIRDTHTSDLWPYTGKDGRDYCIVGTWGGDGYAHVFDITDLTNIVRTALGQGRRADDQRRHRLA